MALPAESSIDTAALMASVRAALGQTDTMRADAQVPPVVLSPHFHHEQLLLDQAQRVAAVGTTVPPFGGLRRMLRPLARLTTWALHRVLQVITVDQRVFNGLLLNVARMTSAGLAQGEAALNARLSRGEAAAADSARQLAELREALADLGTVVAARERAEDVLTEQLRVRDDSIAALNLALTARQREHTALSEQWRSLHDCTGEIGQRIDLTRDALAALARRVTAAQAGIAAQERRLVTLGEAALRTSIDQPPDGSATTVALLDESAHALEALHVSFAERFRGSADEIRERLRVYLPDVHAVGGASPGLVLDLGCGRGEWLSLLAEEGIAARGVDANRLLVAQGRAAGLAMIEGDVLQHLAVQPDASTDVVTAFHLIEHLSFPQLVALLDHAVRILRPGGLLILETPNPDNVLVGSGLFYLDSAHRHPLPSPLLRFLAEARGLGDVEVRPLHPAPEYDRFDDPSDLAGRLNGYFFGPRDYAVLGRRA